MEAPSTSADLLKVHNNILFYTKQTLQPYNPAHFEGDFIFPPEIVALAEKDASLFAIYGERRMESTVPMVGGAIQRWQLWEYHRGHHFADSGAVHQS